jgi:hypothetical protein
MPSLQLRSDGFERMADKNGTDIESGASGSELELQERRPVADWIRVDTDIEMRVEELGHSGSVPGQARL